jgi:hypothetical protein
MSICEDIKGFFGPLRDTIYCANEVFSFSVRFEGQFERLDPHCLISKFPESASLDGKLKLVCYLRDFFLSYSYSDCIPFFNNSGYVIVRNESDLKSMKVFETLKNTLLSEHKLLDEMKICNFIKLHSFSEVGGKMAILEHQTSGLTKNQEMYCYSRCCEYFRSRGYDVFMGSKSISLVHRSLLS